MAITSIHHQQMHQRAERVGDALRDLLAYWQEQHLNEGLLSPTDGTYPFTEDLVEVIAKVDTASMKLYDRAHADTATCKNCQHTITLLDDRWVDTGAIGDEFTARETCDDNHEDPFAAHEPERLP